ncbi:hypothetical protein OLMES_2045 [Oleiphilus messinensis]|uniref:YcxB-like C-terminal domain-containing protein n=1 Tax=Oleiphilus messinensis TaxID=141451 RepID=A0A1Y0I6J8_9GAMM|nr:YcxB family protein [Oleiphilus messinensis]ARU56118.1 hypothetical protein OLMES_2045 [Oleiphilus messinensis]
MKVELSEQDYIDATRLHARQPVIFMSILVLIVGVVSALASDSLGIEAGTVLEAMVGALVGIALYYFWIVRLWCKRIYRQQRNLQTPYELTWDQNRVIMVGEYGESSIPWSNFVKYRENEDLILMYYSDALYNLVTKRSFDSLEELDQFRNFLSKQAN